ncbi:inositol monophosphatase [Candidatus Uhrbacteria bacterium]|nr:inositol monophosphatase [Candidatus Uhrbacteria bacterium]
MDSLSLQRSFAIELARNCATYIRNHFTLGITKEWKEDKSPVTAVDKAVDRRVIRAIQKQFPNDTIISEESPARKGTSGDAWVIDPIDGTIPFSHGVPTFCFSLAFVRDGKPLIGVIIDPIARREFIGIHGVGATCNKKRMQLPRIVSSRPLVALEGFFRWDRAPIVYPTIAQKYLVVQLACITYDAMMVALGNFGATVYPYKNPWDIAAVDVIVREAGGIVTNLSGAPQRYDQPIHGAIISHPQLYSSIKKMVGRK